MLFAQNGVKVSGLAVSAGTVTFNVQWTNNHTPGFLWSDSVWVFVDYNEAGVMTRLPLLPGATLTDTSAPGVGEVVEVDNNDRGVWIIGNAKTASSGSFSATVKLLTATANVTGACAYASNYPPVGNYTSATDISFTGTPDYQVVLERNDKSTYTVTIHKDESLSIPGGEALLSFTDKTEAPGITNCTPPAAQQLIVSAATYCAGLGVAFALANTETGAIYQLYAAGAPLDGATFTGTGSPATFSGSFRAGTYSARTMLSSIFCPAAMTGSHTVSENPVPENPTITAASRCGAGTVTLMASSSDAEIDWYNVESGGTSVTTGNSYTTSSLTATSTYHAQARTTAGCLSAARMAVAATINPVPTITCRSGAANQGIIRGTALPTIVYTASSAATISMTGGSFPTGVAGAASGSSFTISGTPSATSTHGYTLTAAVGGCPYSTSGTITVVSSIQGVASTQTWVIGSQTWSAPLKKAQAGCTQTTDFGSTNPPTTAYYRSSGLYNSSSGYLYNWKCITDYATQLCPSPWKVPTSTDFVNLDKALEGTGANRTETAAWVLSKYVNQWGAVYAGYAQDDTWLYRGEAAVYASSSDFYISYQAYDLVVYDYGEIRPQGHAPQRFGYQVRCVR